MLPVLRMCPNIAILKLTVWEEIHRSLYSKRPPFHFPSLCTLQVRPIYNDHDMDDLTSITFLEMIISGCIFLDSLQLSGYG